MRNIVFAIATVGALTAYGHAATAAVELSRQKCGEIVNITAMEYERVSDELGLEAGAYLDNKKVCRDTYPDLTSDSQSEQGGVLGLSALGATTGNNNLTLEDDEFWSPIREGSGREGSQTEIPDDEIVDVPVPATAGLVFAGLGVLGFFRRRRLI